MVIEKVSTVPADYSALRLDEQLADQAAHVVRRPEVTGVLEHRGVQVPAVGGEEVLNFSIALKDVERERLEAV